MIMKNGLLEKDQVIQDYTEGSVRYKIVVDEGGRIWEYKYAGGRCREARCIDWNDGGIKK